MRETPFSSAACVKLVNDRRTSDAPPHCSSGSGNDKLHAVKLMLSSLKNRLNTCAACHLQRCGLSRNPGSVAWRQRLPHWVSNSSWVTIGVRKLNRRNWSPEIIKILGIECPDISIRHCYIQQAKEPGILP